MKGVEFLRKLYANAGFSIRPQARSGKVDLLKQMARTVGASSSDQGSLRGTCRASPNLRHATGTENDEVQALTKVFVDKVRDQLKGSSAIPEPPVIRV